MRHNSETVYVHCEVLKAEDNVTHLGGFLFRLNAASMSTTALYNDHGGAEAAVEAGLESTPTSSGSTGAAFGLFSADFKK